MLQYTFHFCSQFYALSKADQILNKSFFSFSRMQKIGLTFLSNFKMTVSVFARQCFMPSETSFLPLNFVLVILHSSAKSF